MAYHQVSVRKLRRARRVLDHDRVRELSPYGKDLLLRLVTPSDAARGYTTQLRATQHIIQCEISLHRVIRAIVAVSYEYDELVQLLYAWDVEEVIVVM